MSVLSVLSDAVGGHCRTSLGKVWDKIAGKWAAPCADVAGRVGLTRLCGTIPT